MMLRGDSADAISKALGGVVSRATVGRRMSEMRYGAGDVPAGPAEAELPEDPENVPADTDPATVDKWIARVEKLAQVAELHQDAKRLGELGRLANTLFEAKRKATPIAKVDPNDAPDMIAAKEEARAAFRKLAKQAAEGRY